MTLNYSLYGYHHVREHFLRCTLKKKPTYDSDSARFATTKGFKDAKYYIKNTRGTFVDLAAVFPSYSASFEDAAELYLLKQQ